MFKKTFALAAAIAMFAASAAFAASALEKDVLMAGTESTYPPYDMRNDKGELTGFEVEFTNTIAQKLGKKVEWLDMSFDGLIPALITNKVDIVAGGFSATPERAKVVSFTLPYEISFSAFVMRPDNLAKNVDELAGKIIAVQIGTVQESFARSLGNVEVKTFQKFDDCVREVIFGRADATLMDIPVAKSYTSAEDFVGKVEIAFNKQITGADKALAVNKNDTAFLDAVNEVIKTMDDSGELKALHDKWFK